nr:replication associated protein [Banana bunchy top virus associated alphasatellite 6]
MSVRNWVFTRNFEGERPELLFGGETQYAAWQHERKNHDHLQGVIQLKKKTRLNAVKSIIGGNPHVEPMRASFDDALAYVMKDETRIDGPWEFGIRIRKGSNKRKLLEILEDSDNEVLQPQKYRRAMAKQAMSESKKKAAEEGFSYELREWQVQLTKLLEEEPDNRTIIWVYGPKGGEGKTEFAKHLGLKDGWTYLPGGELKDMMYLLSKDMKNNVVIDFPRCTKEFISYKFLEMVKNRTIYSYKYEPVGSIVCNKVHVVVFSNEEPDYVKLSLDRIKLISC